MQALAQRTANAKFSEVFRLARTEAVRQRGCCQYQRLTVKSHRPKSMVQFFRLSPLAGVDLDLERNRDACRSCLIQIVFPGCWPESIRGLQSSTA